MLKEQGIENPEDYVLTQYYMSNDPTKLPTPIDADTSLEGGILVLNPEESGTDGDIPQVGGLFGTIKSMFRVIGFQKKVEEVPVSKDVAKRKRSGGLYDTRIR